MENTRKQIIAFAMATLNKNGKRFLVSEKRDVVRFKMLNYSIDYVIEKTFRGWVMYPDLSKATLDKTLVHDDAFNEVSRFIDKINFIDMTKGAFDGVSFFKSGLLTIQEGLYPYASLIERAYADDNQVIVEFKKSQGKDRVVRFYFVVSTLQWEADWSGIMDDQFPAADLIRVYDSMNAVIDIMSAENAAKDLGLS